MHQYKYVYYLHGVLLSAFASMSIYVTFQDASIYSPPNAILRLTIFSLLGYVFFVSLSYLITRDHDTSGLIATLLVLGFMYIWRSFLVIFVAGSLAWLGLAIVGKKVKTFQLHISLIAVSIAMSVYSGVQFYSLTTNVHWGKYENLTESINFAVSEPPVTKPDIYYIILDGYGSEEMLDAIHGYDNSKFVGELETRGFSIADNSRSNYIRTILSLGSSLNMQYLDTISEEMGDSYLWWPLMGTISQNQVRQFLGAQGYLSVSIANGWDFTSLEVADVLVKPYPIFLNKFEELYFQSTNLSTLSFLNKLGVSIPAYDTHRRTVLFEFEKISDISEDVSSPKFVFVHIISPHAPFIFDKDGSSLTPSYPFTFADDRYFLSPPSKYRSGYLAQLEYINQKTLEAIDAILENSKEPPIIVLQGDHGSGVYMDYHSADNSCLYERFSILNAYYLPGMPLQSFPSDISPVNTFRMIFNEYFHAELPYLPNKQYFSSSSTLYQFEDVSMRVDQPCRIDDID